MEFRVIEGFPYEIWEDGRIFRTERTSKSGRKLHKIQVTPYKLTNGYLIVRLYCTKDDSYKKCYLHRLVWQAFNGEIPKGYEVDHKNGLRSGKGSNGVDANSLSNLRVVSHKENCANEVSKERYRVANAIDKGKYHCEKMQQARTKEHYQLLKVEYKKLKEEYDKVGTFLVIQKLHVGYPRAKKLMNEMENEKKN